ncbi:MAG: glutamate 5-kinase [Zymomonas mobilis]|uniref:glutamate 5-kinase n=1 Tax=Zymomonas mobilis TaxID=542 RepID=UPI0001B70781|nr:glutamate 5-kinase [Zymomonas mobilis]ACV75550.1 glutamate 5-kinase [Zymomonas mobilis subsp. mobilis NCIMB 11163]AHB10337.1 glutamate 5-kinase [Zymomonas mobilis subsp. mobilis str. CP4 = NRRL B-14023]AHJ70643.1 Glutamate 5-kinase [Zymomonas mobilis subsp. mobilis NRRL B-12526]AHJ72497.1 Glutamate 5-kinase [Zymomonas mobilis subsp. mobilis str. CP4 = NRRL B-14023]MCP9308620.1 glutamate 5-kinase [Zymomonas mobilis]
MVADLTSDISESQEQEIETNSANNNGAVFRPENCPRLVIKIGSSLLVDQRGQVRRDWLQTVAYDIAKLHQAGQQIIVVSSGAIALGARRLNLPRGGRASLEDAQASASVGQILLSQCWAELLGACSLDSSQILLTLDDLEDRRRYLNVSATLDRLLSLGVVPVINENDSIATAEIRFGDNDRLAARIGQASHASGVILFSDVDGLYTANPMKDPNAKRIDRVEHIDNSTEAMASSDSASGMGSGGMASKVEAARIATYSGVNLAITTGKRPSPLTMFLDDGAGTLFTADESASAHKTWLAGRLTAHGQVYIDQGAVEALHDGNSLLPAGVCSIEGKFNRGDVVDILDQEHNLIARGLIEYDSEDSAQITGKRSQEIADILGYEARTALIHRNHMVML